MMMVYSIQRAVQQTLMVTLLLRDQKCFPLFRLDSNSMFLEYLCSHHISFNLPPPPSAPLLKYTPDKPLNAFLPPILHQRMLQPFENHHHQPINIGESSPSAYKHW